ncbi:hypothetical protein FEM08_27950 [Flavobacterium gilvum]|nr:hypothetical protein FEM08_27950 [Flavobacterium gilvum]
MSLVYFQLHRFWVEKLIPSQLFQSKKFFYFKFTNHKTLNLKLKRSEKAIL